MPSMFHKTLRKLKPNNDGTGSTPVQGKSSHRPSSQKVETDESSSNMGHPNGKKPGMPHKTRSKVQLTQVENYTDYIKVYETILHKSKYDKRFLSPNQNTQDTTVDSTADKSFSVDSGLPPEQNLSNCSEDNIYEIPEPRGSKPRTDTTRKQVENEATGKVNTKDNTRQRTVVDKEVSERTKACTSRRTLSTADSQPCHCQNCNNGVNVKRQRPSCSFDHCNPALQPYGYIAPGMYRDMYYYHYPERTIPPACDCQQCQHRRCHFGWPYADPPTANVYPQFPVSFTETSGHYPHGHMPVPFSFAAPPGHGRFINQAWPTAQHLQHCPPPVYPGLDASCGQKPTNHAHTVLTNHQSGQETPSDVASRDSLNDNCSSNAGSNVRINKCGAMRRWSSVDCLCPTYATPNKFTQTCTTKGITPGNPSINCAIQQSVSSWLHDTDDDCDEDDDVFESSLEDSRHLESEAIALDVGQQNAVYTSPPRAAGNVSEITPTKRAQNGHSAKTTSVQNQSVTRRGSHHSEVDMVRDSTSGYYSETKEDQNVCDEISLSPLPQCQKSPYYEDIDMGMNMDAEHSNVLSRKENEADDGGSGANVACRAETAVSCHSNTQAGNLVNYKVWGDSVTSGSKADAPTCEIRGKENGRIFNSPSLRPCSDRDIKQKAISTKQEIGFSHCENICEAGCLTAGKPRTATRLKQQCLRLPADASEHTTKTCKSTVTDGISCSGTHAMTDLELHKSNCRSRSEKAQLTTGNVSSGGGVWGCRDRDKRERHMVMGGRHNDRIMAGTGAMCNISTHRDNIHQNHSQSQRGSNAISDQDSLELQLSSDSSAMQDGCSCTDECGDNCRLPSDDGYDDDENDGNPPPLPPPRLPARSSSSTCASSFRVTPDCPRSARRSLLTSSAAAKENKENALHLDQQTYFNLTRSGLPSQTRTSWAVAIRNSFRRRTKHSTVTADGIKNKHKGGNAIIRALAGSFRKRKRSKTIEQHVNLSCIAPQSSDVESPPPRPPRSLLREKRPAVPPRRRSLSTIASLKVDLQDADYEAILASILAQRENQKPTAESNYENRQFSTPVTDKNVTNELLPDTSMASQDPLDREQSKSNVSVALTNISLNTSSLANRSFYSGVSSLVNDSHQLDSVSVKDEIIQPKIFGRNKQSQDPVFRRPLSLANYPVLPSKSIGFQEKTNIKLIKTIRCKFLADKWICGLTFTKKDELALVDMRQGYLVDRTGALKRVIGSRDPGHLNAPLDVTTLPNGTLVFSDSVAQDLKLYTPKGQHVRTLSGTMRCHSYTAGIATTRKREIISAGCDRNRLTVQTEDGRLLCLLPPRGSPSPFEHPYSVAVNPLTDDIIVGDDGKQEVMALSREGRVLWRFSRAGHRHFFPRSICVDSQGYIFVSDLYNENVYMLDSSGKYICTVVTRGRGLQGSPAAIAVDGKGHLAVADEERTVRILKYEQNGFIIGSRSNECPKSPSSPESNGH